MPERETEMMNTVLHGTRITRHKCSTQNSPGNTDSDRKFSRKETQTQNCKAGMNDAASIDVSPGGTGEAKVTELKQTQTQNMKYSVQNTRGSMEDYVSTEVLAVGISTPIDEARGNGVHDLGEESSLHMNIVLVIAECLDVYMREKQAENEGER
jgi:hypothetical protein